MKEAPAGGRAIKPVGSTGARVTRAVGSLGITALLLIAILSEQTPTELVALAANVRLDLVLVYAALSLFGLFVRAARYGIALRLLAAGSRQPSLPALLMITGIRNALVDFLPARLGELSVLYVLHRCGVALSTAALVFGICLIFDVAALVALLAVATCAAFGLPQLGLELGAKPLTLAVFLCGAGVALAALLCYLAPLARAAARLLSGRRWGKHPRALAFSQILERMAGELAHVSAASAVLPLLGASVLLRVIKYGSLYLLFLAVVHQWGITGADVSPVRTTLAFLAAEATASLPVSGLMGFGAYEGAWTVVFAGASLQVPSIPAVIFLVHLVSQALAYSVGLLAAACLLAPDLMGRKSRRQRTTVK